SLPKIGSRVAKCLPLFSMGSHPGRYDRVDCIAVSPSHNYAGNFFVNCRGCGKMPHLRRSGILPRRQCALEHPCRLPAPVCTYRTSPHMSDWWLEGGITTDFSETLAMRQDAESTNPNRKPKTPDPKSFYPPASSSSRRSVTNMHPGLCVIISGGRTAIATACGVTPHAQKTGNSLSA